MTYVILALVVLAGFGQPIQVAANTQLRDAVRSPALAAAMSFVIGTLALGAFALVGVPGGRGRIAGALQAPWWSWVGGLLGAFSVIMAIVAVKRSNKGTVIQRQQDHRRPPFSPWALF